jgi:hypothetical protein
MRVRCRAIAKDARELRRTLKRQERLRSAPLALCGNGRRWMTLGYIPSLIGGSLCLNPSAFKWKHSASNQ